MVIGVLLIHLRIPNSDSLKAKRQVILSLKSRLKNTFNVSIAEIGLLNYLKEAELGVCCISNSGRYIDKQLSYIMNKIESNRSVEVIKFSTEKI